MDSSGVLERMEVFASDGQRVGVVAGVEGDTIRLAGGGQQRVPLAWVETVDMAVYLSKPSDEVAALARDSPLSFGG